MSERTDLPRITPDKKPSIWNYQMVEGVWLGSMGGALVGLLGLATNAPGKVMGSFVALGTAIGAYWRGNEGLKEQEREQREGRVVKTPGYFNWGMFAGAALVDTAHTVHEAIRSRTNSSYYNSMTYWIPMVAAAAVGSVIRKEGLQRDFDKAVAIRDQQTRELHGKLDAVLATKPGALTPTPQAQQITAESLETALVKEPAR